MLEWLWRLISAALGRESAAQIAAQVKHDKYADDAREDFRTLTVAYDNLMRNYQQMNQELMQRIDALDAKVTSLESALEREKLEHRECRQKLTALESQLKQLKGRVDVIQEKQSDDNA
jgi:peptidoglycan hydrolase CwlO-like protein